jgi:hypothetical protein
MEKLGKLYSNAKQQQWDAERQIDWDREIDPAQPIIEEERFSFRRIPFFRTLSKTQRDDFTAHVAAHRLSQFLHGEQGALMTSAALTHAVPDYEGKLYAATQTMDEARHVEVFKRYVDKLALVYPISRGLKLLIDATLKQEKWVKIAIGMNMVIEGLALGAFHNMRRQTSCALLRQVVENVLRDESRHVAFGNVYVGKAIAEMHEDDREDVAQFAFEALRALAFTVRPPEAQARRERERAEQKGERQTPRDPSFRMAIENAGIDPADYMKGMQEAREAGIEIQQEPGTIHAFKDLMMPALFRVGAVTERTRKLFEEHEIPICEDERVLRQLEDADTGGVEMDGADRVN